MRRSMVRLLAMLLPWSPLCSAVQAEPAPRWPDSHLGRVEATAVIQGLNARLLAGRSATVILEHWCAEHAIAEIPVLTALRQRGAEKPASAETRQRLQVGPDAPLGYRQVRLACGDKVLSEADNWYVPERLTPEMNRVLETTDTPFGRAVQALDFTRQTVASDILWRPLPEGWDQAAPAAPACTALAIPDRLFSHRAVLFTAARVPFAEVVETYGAAILDFARADRPADPACARPVSLAP